MGHSLRAGLRDRAKVLGAGVRGRAIMMLLLLLLLFLWLELLM